MNEVSQIPPHNLESEKEILSGLIHGEQVEGLIPEHFYSDHHRQIFEEASKGNFDLTSLSDALTKRFGEEYFLNSLGGLSGLMEIANYGGMNLKRHAEIIRESFERRNLIDEARRQEEAAFDLSKPLDIPKTEERKIHKSEDLYRMEAKENPFLIRPLIVEGAINGLTADTGRGKSLTALLMAHAVAKGEKFLDCFETKKTKVLIIDSEMSGDEIASRFQAVGKGEELGIHYIFDADLKIDRPADYAWLKKAIQDNNYGFLIVDTLTNFHSAEENSANEMREVNQLFLKLIRETGITPLFLHHHRKRLAGEFAGPSSSRGSTEISAKFSSHLLLESKVEKDEALGHTILNLTLSQEKSRRAESIGKIAFKVVYDQNIKMTTWEYLGPADETNRVEQAKKFIYETLEKNPDWLSTKDLQSLADMEKTIGQNAVSKALKELVSDELIEIGKGKDIGMEQSRSNYYRISSNITSS